MRYLLLTLLFSLSLSTSAQDPLRTLYVDFGPDDGTNGNATSSPDANGIHWNNWTSPTSNVAIPMIDEAGVSVEFGLFMTGAMSTNGINHGGLLAPSGDLLGEYAIPTVTQDYFFTNNTGSFRITRLDPTKAYRLTFFGSRENSQERITRYRVSSGDQEMSYELTTSGTDIGANGYDGNNNMVVTTELLSGGSGFDVSIERVAGSFAYIGLLKMEEFTGDDLVPVTALELAGDDITENGGTTQVSATVVPMDASFQEVVWSTNSPSLATISPDGFVTAIADGTATFIAQSTQPGTSVRARISIEISNQNSRSVFVDCGPDDGINGNASPATDANGIHWNNATNPISSADPVPLRDALGTTTDYVLTIGKAMSTNGINHGGLSAPADSLLGDFAIATATQDYFFTSNSGILTFSGLDPEKGYRFHLLASRESTSPRSTTYAVNGLNGASSTVNASGSGIGENGYDGNNNRIVSTGLVRPLEDGTLNLEVAREIGQFGYLNALRMMEYDGFEICPDQDEQLITFMGSSVARGQGAPNDEGYAFQYTQLLQERFDSMRSDNEWTVRNVSVGGDNTPKVLRRFGSDLVSACGSYVLFGLSLANEGIRNGDEAVFNQFRDNLRTLIDRSRAVGLQPIIVSNYPRGDYDAQDYQFIKDMNLLIYQWDVPSVNVLGAIDDGNGRWAAGFQDDVGHPNLAGHEVFFSAFVPSLFDALADGKTLPGWEESTNYVFDPLEDRVSFIPEDTVRSYSVVLDVKADEAQTLLRFLPLNDGTSARELKINQDGNLTLTGTDGEAITDTETNLFGENHRIAITYSYVRQRTEVYLEGIRIPGFLGGRNPLGEVVFGGHPDSIVGTPAFEASQLQFYRSALNEDEVSALQENTLLQGSLEIYDRLGDALFAGTGVSFTNRAQSTNELVVRSLVSTNEVSIRPNYRVYPNPTNGKINVETSNGITQIKRIEVYDLLGRRLQTIKNRTEVDLGPLGKGTYVLRVYGARGVGVSRVVRE